jgi:acetyltransferase-like isoleucine patch superfamily enzyme
MQSAAQMLVGVLGGLLAWLRAVIGTGSVVSGELRADALAVGDPARRIRDRPAAAFTYVPDRQFA